VNGPKQPTVVPDIEYSMLLFQKTWLSARFSSPQTEEWRWIADPERLEPFVPG
jgi:hypothetical protein